MAAQTSNTRRRGPGRPAGGQGEGQEALLAAARELMAEKGLPRVTVREVAERAGVQPALVSYYFGSKRGLLQAVVADVASRMLVHMRESAGRGAHFEERLRAIVHDYMSLVGEDPYGPRLIVEQVLFGEEEAIDSFADRFARRNMELIEKVIREGREAGEIRDVDAMFMIPALLGSCLFFFLAAPIMKRIFGIDEITPELTARYADFVVDMNLRGLLARPEETS